MDFEERVAVNEANFRDVNKSVATKGCEIVGGSEALPFLCECARPDCTDMIDATIDEYDSIHADPARFIITAGHNLPGVEKVVEERGERYWVVEKLGKGREIAEAAD